jgi:hypothetical protein
MGTAPKRTINRIFTALSRYGIVSHNNNKQGGSLWAETKHKRQYWQSHNEACREERGRSESKHSA